MPKKKKSFISESQIKKELSKINLELNNIAKKSESKKEEPEKPDEEEEEEEQETGFHESLESGRASRRFTAPILLPSGQESIENLEDFAALIPSSRNEGEEKEVAYASEEKKKYAEGALAGTYDSGGDYNANAKYSSENPAPPADERRIATPFIREDFTRGRVLNEMQPAAGMQAKTDWEERSRLEEFARMQTEYQVKEEKEAHEKRKRGG